MCSPIKFTRPGARTTCTGPKREGGAPNARANAAPRGVEAMRLEISRKSRSVAPAVLRMTGPLAPRRPHPLTPLRRQYKGSGRAPRTRTIRPGAAPSRRRQLTHGTTRGPQVRELHLGILAGQEHPVRASLERRPHGLIYVLGLRLLVACPRGNVDVDAGPDFETRSRSSYGTAGLAQHVVGREALRSNPIERPLAVLLHAVGEL